MRGSAALHSIKRNAAVFGIAAAVTVQMSGAASAHHLQDYQRQRNHIEDRAKTQRGAPYSYGGSSPRGFDCSGFTRWVYRDHGASLPHSSMEQFRMAERDNHRRVWNRKNLRPGDLVFHKTTSARVGHAGIYIGNGRFISSTSSDGVRVSSLYDGYWGPRWVGATRLPVTIRYRDR